MQLKSEIERMILGPEGWETDELTGFISVAEDRTRDVFEAYKDDWQSIGKLRSIFHDTVVEAGKTPNNLTGELLMMANSYFMAAARLITAGQGITAFPLLRSTLECSLYAWHLAVADTKQREATWRDRQKGPAERKATVAEFGSPSKIINELAKTEASLSEDVKSKYEKLIDYGAHPNVGGFLAHCVLVATDGGFAVRHDSLIADPFWIQQTFDDLRQTVILTLRVFNLVFPTAASSIASQDRLHTVEDLASTIKRALPTIPIEFQEPRQEDLTALREAVTKAFSEHFPDECGTLD